MRVGILPLLNPELGGAFQFSLSMVEAVAQIGREDADAPHFTLLVRPGQRSALPRKNTMAWRRVVSYGSIGERLTTAVKAHVENELTRRILARAWGIGKQVLAPAPNSSGTALPNGRSMRRHRIDWVLYTSPVLDCLSADVPFVMPIFDLQHRHQPEFPEVSADGEYDERERLYRHAARRATLLIADSDVGKEDFLACYAEHGITEDRIKVLQSVPAPYLSGPVTAGERGRIREKYRLPRRYFFYPAQFWPHKNHLRIVQALALLSSRSGVEAHIVFAGSYGGTLRSEAFEYVMAEARRSRVADQVHYIGYAPNDDMAGLYAEACGLVMPTFFGPTNIPVLEAWMLGCPVLTSDIRGIREQVGDAGLLVDPRSIEAIGDAMGRLWEDDGLRATLAERGATKLAAYGPTEFRRTLAGIIEEGSRRVSEAAGTPRLRDVQIP